MPIELIVAMPAAADAPVKKAPGSGQNKGGMADTPIWLRQSKPSTIAGEVEKPAPTRPTQARTMAANTCSRRFRVRSELRPSSTMPTAPNTNGSAASRPVSKLLAPKPLTMVGRKNATP